MKLLSASQARSLLMAEAEIAFLDIREHGQYGEGHPFFSVNLPYSELELDAARLMPRRDVPILLLDDGDGVSARAASRLAAIGYGDVTAIDGGAPAWAAAGYTLFKGVNVPSKTFGEIIEHEMGTPSTTAEALQRRLESGDDLILLDGRSPEEFRKMNVPGAASCPNAEIGHRLAVLAPDPNTTVVVNCAGRTRSIIGAQSLRNQGVPNPVLALENGTQGWRLSGFALERGSEPGAMERLDEGALAQSRARGRDLRARFNLPAIDAATLALWRQDPSRSLYLFDVRTREEFAAGTHQDAVFAPGGQLVQATDQWVAARGARIVLADDTGLRAANTALWLRAMGHDAYLLDLDISIDGAAAHPSTQGAACPALPSVKAENLAQCLRDGATLLDLSPGMAYRRGHLAPAIWATRARLADAVRGIEADRELILADGDSGRAALAALDLQELGFTRLRHLDGTPETWREAGLEVVATPDSPDETDCIDFLFFVHDRHDDNLEASRRYLAWETGLIAQLEADERAVFHIPKNRID